MPSTKAPAATFIKVVGAVAAAVTSIVSTADAKSVIVSTPFPNVTVSPFAIPRLVNVSSVAATYIPVPAE